MVSMSVSNTDSLSHLKLTTADHFLDRSHNILSLEHAQKRDIGSLKNWVSGNGCLDEDETAYLEHGRELATLAPVRDSTIVHLETWVEDKLIRFCGGFRKVCTRTQTRQVEVNTELAEQSRFHDISNDPHVYIYSGPWVKRIARAFLLLLITLLLLTPIIICNIVSNTLSRIIVVMVSTICYLVILSWLTRTRTIELILAGAT
jgi:hypothetical protein